MIGWGRQSGLEGHWFARAVPRRFLEISLRSSIKKIFLFLHSWAKSGQQSEFWNTTHGDPPRGHSVTGAAPNPTYHQPTAFGGLVTHASTPRGVSKPQTPAKMSLSTTTMLAKLPVFPEAAVPVLWIHQHNHSHPTLFGYGFCPKTKTFKISFQLFDSFSFEYHIKNTTERFQMSRAIEWTYPFPTFYKFEEIITFPVIYHRLPFNYIDYWN